MGIHRNFVGEFRARSAATPAERERKEEEEKERLRPIIPARSPSLPPSLAHFSVEGGRTIFFGG